MDAGSRSAQHPADGLARTRRLHDPARGRAAGRDLPRQHAGRALRDTRRRHVLLLRARQRRSLAQVRTAPASRSRSTPRRRPPRSPSRPPLPAASSAASSTSLGSATDATSGVATNTRRVGPVGACASGTNVPQRWDTTRFTDGTYDLCNIVTDNAGYTATATLRITIPNAVPVPPPIPAPPEPAGAAPAPRSSPRRGRPGRSRATRGGARRERQDRARTRRRSSRSSSRARARARRSCPLTLHWVNPKADDLDRVLVVLNLKRQPRSKADGTILYSGLRASTTFKLRAGLERLPRAVRHRPHRQRLQPGPENGLAGVAHPAAAADGQQGRRAPRA